MQRRKKSLAGWSRSFTALTAVMLAAGVFSFRAFGADKTFVLNGAPISLRDATDSTAVFYQSLRYNRASGIWNVEVTVSNKSPAALEGPIVLLIESFSGTTGALQSDGLDDSTPAKAFFDLGAFLANNALQPGERSRPRTLSLGFVSGAAPKVDARVYVKVPPGPSALALTRTLNEAGQPLPSVQVEEFGPQTQTNRQTDPVFGVVTLGQDAGAHTWKFSAANYLPVWRQQTLGTGAVTVLPNPRLTRRNSNSVTLTSIGGGTLKSSDSKTQIQFGPGSVAQDTSATLTPLGPQTLPGFLPVGWSPLNAFWFELPTTPGAPGMATLESGDSLRPEDVLAFARWNEAAIRWEVLQTFSGITSNTLTPSLAGAGAYALVIADSGALAPPTPQAGQPLPPSAASLPAISNLVAGGLVNPSTSPASAVAELVTATANVTITNPAGPIPSGLLLRGEVTERYAMSDGSQRHPPQYENFVAGYQRPGDAQLNTANAIFPLRPFLLFGPEQLKDATVRVDVLGPTPFSGTVLDASGGSISGNGLRVLAGTDDVIGKQAALLRSISVSNFTDFASNGVSVAAAFELTLTGVAPARQLRLQFDALPTNGVFVLARVEYQQGLYGLQPLERFATDAAARLLSTEPASGSKLDGLTGSGQFVLLRLPSAQALVTGIARNSQGQPAGNLPVRVTGQPWLAFSDAAGGFKLLAPTGSVEVALTDLTTGDSGFVNLNVPNLQTVGVANPSTAAQGPRVVSVNPTNGAAGVARVSPIIVNFSEPVNPGAIALNGIRLLGTNGQAVAASVTLNLKNTTATLLPTDPLAPSSQFTLQLSTNITDVSGLRLEGQNTFTFRTESDAFNRQIGDLVIYEPTNGLARMTGGPGMAEPNAAVILVNESSGATATVTAGPDGSFDNSLAADADDELRAVLVNGNGTRNTVAPSRQVFSDGSVRLFEGGGTIEAMTEHGPMQFAVDAGAIQGRVKYKLQPVPEAQVSSLLTNVPLEAETKLLGGFVLSQEGEDPVAGPHVSFPINVGTLGLPPGSRPEDASFVLAVPVQTDEGEIVFHIIDRMYFTNGALRTFSPPYQASVLRSLINNLRSSKKLSPATTILNLLGLPSLQDVIIHQLMLPMMIAQGTSQTLFGGVVSVEASVSGSIVGGSDRPVPGAVISVTRDDQSSGRPGRLMPGGMFTTSDARGRYALTVPANKLEQPGFVGSAIHPAFPFQRPSVGAQLGSLAAQLRTTSVGAQMDFVFQRIPVGANTGPDETMPSIHIAVAPRDPLPGTNVNEGATITLSGFDDQTLASLDMVIESFDPFGSFTNPPQPLLTAIPGSQLVLGPAAIQQTYRLTTELRGDVTLLATATDDAGHLREARTIASFAGNRIIFGNTNDTVGPRILFTLPPDGAQGLPPGNPMIVQFSEPVDAGLMTNPAPWLTLANGTLSSVQLSSDGRTLSIFFTPQSSGPVNFTINSQLTDVNTNAFDQLPGQSGSQSYTWAVSPLIPNVRNLAEITSGGGVVTKGQYAFALERTPGGSQNAGAVFVYDLSGSAPSKVAELPLAGPARDLALIPNYSFKPTESGSCQTGDLLAVVGGTISGDSPFQYLRVFDVTDPSSPVRIAGSSISLNIAAVTKVQWAPPWILYLESGADITDVGVIDLQSYIIGMNATPAQIEQFPENGTVGVDLNQDGDYCDSGETTPLPIRSPSEFFGKEFAVLVDAPETNSNRRILDFDFDPESGLFGITASRGAVLGTNGQPTSQQLPPIYRTVSTRSSRLDPAKSTLPLPVNTRPKRVAIFSGVQLITTTNVTFRNLAIVSLADVNPPRLAIVDISNPELPVLLGDIPLVGFGIPQTLQRRGDGLLAVSTSTDVLLFDPAKLLLPAAPGGNLPAFVGTIEDAGAGANSFAAGADGVNAVNLGGKHQVQFSAPTLRIVAFPNRAPAATADILAFSDEEKFEFLANAELRTRLLRTRFFDNSTNQTLLTPATNSHYYVRVDALGSLGPELELVLQGLNSAGQPLPSGGSNRAPARLASSQTLQQLGDTNGSSFPTSLRAKQLSPNPGSSLYNVYLAGPIALTGRSFSSAQVSAIQSQLARNVVTAGRALWIGLDPFLMVDPYPSGVRSAVVQQRLVPGASVYAQVDSPPLPVIFVPGVAGSHLSLTVTVPFFGNIANMGLWPGFTDFGKGLLTLNPSQTQFTIVAPDIVRIAPEPYEYPQRFSPIACFAAPIYEPLLEYLRNQVGLREYDYLKPASGLLDFLPCAFGSSQTVQNTPQESVTKRTVNGADYTQLTNEPNFFVFPYDWRRSNVPAVAQLKEYVEVVKRFHPEAEQVNIVAHSMGGLVSRRFILDNPGVVNRLITLGSPWLGAPKAINALETGDFLDFIQHILVIKKSTLKELAEFFHGPQELVPSPAYFNLAGSPFIDLAGDLPGSLPGVGGGALSFPQFQKVMDEVYHTNVLVSPAAVSTNFHDYSVPGVGSQDDWSTDNTGVEYFHILGIQSAVNTIGKVTSRVRIRPKPEDPVNLFEFKREFTIEYTRGDGTVPIFSSLRIHGGQNLNAPNAHIYQILSPGPDKDKLTDHNGMLANPELLDLVGRLLDGDIPPTNTPTIAPKVTHTVRIVNAEDNEVTAAALSNSAVTSAPTNHLGNTAFLNLLGFVEPLFVSKEEDVPGLQIEEPATNIVDTIMEGQFRTHAGYDDRPISVRVERSIDGVPQTVYLWRGLNPQSFVTPTNPTAPADFELDIEVVTNVDLFLQSGSTRIAVPPDAVVPVENESPKIVFTYTNDCTAIQFGVTNEPNASSVEYYYQPVDPITPAIGTNLFKIDDQNQPGFLEDLEHIAALNGTRRLRIYAQDGNENIAAPVLVDLVKLELFLGLQGNIRLTDHPEDAANNRQRSASRYLRADDEITTRVTGFTNQPTGFYKVKVTSQTDTNGIVVDLVEIPPGSGVYENQGLIDVGSSPSSAVKVIDEELLTFEVLANGIGPLCMKDVMVDAGEFAGGGIHRFYRDSDRLPSLQGAIANAQFSNAGDGQYIDFVGALFPTNNPLTEFISKAGSNFVGRLQSDILLVATHGNTDGTLTDDAGVPVFHPSAVFTPAGDKWNLDVEWAILAACNELNDETNNIGLSSWQKALRGNPRPAHGLLGANFKVASDLSGQMELLWERLNAGDTFPESYKLAMTIGGNAAQPWVVSYYAPYAQDSLTNLASDLGIPGAVPFFTERFITLGQSNITCGRAEGPRVQAAIDLNKTPGAGRIMPPRVELGSTDPLQALPLATKRRFQHGDLRVVEFQPEPAATGPNETSTENARAIAEAFLRTNLPSVFAVAAFGSVSTHVTTRTEPSGASATWTNGFVVQYQIQNGGVPVWGDRLLISVEQNQVTRIATVFHQPMTAPGAARPSASVQSAQMIFDRAKPAIEATLRTGARADILAADLAYVRAQDVLKTGTNSNEFILAWRFQVEINDTQPRLNPPNENYWIDATTGELLGHKPQ